MALTRAMKYFGDGDVVAAAAGAEFSGAGVDGTSRWSQTPRTGRSAGLNALKTRLQLSHLQGRKHLSVKTPAGTLESVFPSSEFREQLQS